MLTTKVIPNTTSIPSNSVVVLVVGDVISDVVAEVVVVVVESSVIINIVLMELLLADVSLTTTCLTCATSESHGPADPGVRGRKRLCGRSSGRKKIYTR